MMCVHKVVTFGDIVVGLMLIGPRDPADFEFFGVMDSLSRNMTAVGAQLERVERLRQSNQARDHDGSAVDQPGPRLF
jgi:hypothetical protein